MDETQHAAQRFLDEGGDDIGGLAPQFLEILGGAARECEAGVIGVYRETIAQLAFTIVNSYVK